MNFPVLMLYKYYFIIIAIHQKTPPRSASTRCKTDPPSTLHSEADLSSFLSFHLVFNKHTRLKLTFAFHQRSDVAVLEVFLPFPQSFP